LPLPLSNLPTEVQPLIEEINRLLERQSAAVRREQRFIADAAHVLRTPLTAIQLQADVLVGARTADERGRRLADLRAGVARAIRIANSLLAIANDEPIRLTSDDCTDLSVALNEIADAYKPIAESGNLVLAVETGPAVRVRGAQRHLAILVGNLLDNALRYTPAGGCVRVTSSSEGDQAVIEVQDDGPGIAESELERVFERFYRGAGDVTPGNGLGLAAVRSVARRLGGDARLHNRTDGSGLIAKIVLPRLS
jgi:two-component system OmpR family sensor kinase